jgi:MOSC domain-containing protein YiiM/GNAT superfamily N-acetyltransferase
MQQARVLQVNVSRGGVPKTPVASAWVSRNGVEGDGHNEPTEHGGPHRAVCLYGIEAIERLQAEGHPVEPGGVGENLTTLGVEWSTLPVGTRARIGSRLLLEIADSTTPCATQKRNFTDGRFSRISIDLHPSESRMYARVLEEGPVEPGDAIEVLPPAPDSRASAELMLKRLDRALGKANLAAWRAAQAAGLGITVVEDGEVVMAAAPALPGPAFNHASGFARLPNLVPMATAFFDRHDVTGWIEAEAPPWPRAQADAELTVFAAAPGDVAAAAAPRGVTLRPLGPAEGPLAEQLMSAAGSTGTSGAPAGAWAAVLSGLAAHPHGGVLIAEQDEQAVALAVLYVQHATAWLRGAVVVPAARGKGLQRVLVAERVRLARERGCTLVGASAADGSASWHNLERLGLRPIGTRGHYRYQPAAREEATAS